MKVLIPAKGTSKRIPKKNLRELVPGVSLLAWTIKNYQRWFDCEIYVGTEDKETVELATSLGCKIFDITEDDINDKRCGSGLLNAFINQYQDTTVLAQCTSPFTFKSDVISALNNLKTITYSGYRGIFHFCEYNGILSQSIPEVKLHTGNFYIAKHAVDIKEWAKEEYMHEVNLLSMLDINTWDDLKLARWLALRITPDDLAGN